MNILHAHKYFHERDGAGRYMLGLMRLEAAAGHTVAPFAMQTPQNIASPWDKYFVSELSTAEVGHGMTAIRQASRALWSHEAKTKMESVLRDFRPDIVHAHNIYTHLSPSILYACKHANVPVVMTVHDYALVSANYALWGGEEPIVTQPGFVDVLKTKFIKGSAVATFALETITRLQRFLGLYDRLITHYLAPSNFVRDVLEHTGIERAKITVAYPFIEAHDHATHGPRQDDGTILFVGRLEQYKGVETLLAVARMLPHVRFRIVGDGSDRHRFMDVAKDLSNVVFDGFLDRRALAEAYCTARALVVPSRWYEPFGLVMLEAMSEGVPVIVSDRGGLPEIIDHGQNGFVFPAGNAPALAMLVRDLVDHPEKAQAVGQAGQERAAEIGDPALHLKTVLEVYSSAQKEFRG